VDVDFALLKVTPPPPSSSVAVPFFVPPITSDPEEVEGRGPITLLLHNNKITLLLIPKLLQFSKLKF
jgi:hypothetical protein